MKPYYQDDLVTLHHGDCLDVLAYLPDRSVDAVVTDPPYELAFMGRAWDASGIAFNPAVWAQCLRILKPGGHLLAFGGSRTWHRLSTAIEDAGFEIRDSIAWLYGSGFPKSLDMSKAIDKAGGVAPQRQAEVLRNARERAGLTRDHVALAVGCTLSSVRDWEEGRARATGRAIEWITPSPEYRDKLADLLGYTADERRVVGTTVDRRADGTVIGLGHSGVEYGDAATDAAKQWKGWGTALKPAFEPIVVARKPLAGTVAANVLEHGTGALNIDACRVGTGERVNPAGSQSSLQRVSRVEQGYRDNLTSSIGGASIVSGRWPTNVVLDEHQAEALDLQSGTSTSRVGKPRGAASGAGWGMTTTGAEYADEGGASRFFPVFRYEAKAPTSERPRADGVQHPTVKPLDLMRWLVRLVTPVGAVVLEPFAGSGTTAEACILEDRRCIAIEREAEYLPLIVSRLRKPVQQGLFGLGAGA